MQAENTRRGVVPKMGIQFTASIVTDFEYLALYDQTIPSFFTDLIKTYKIKLRQHSLVILE